MVLCPWTHKENRFQVSFVICVFDDLVLFPTKPNKIEYTLQLEQVSFKQLATPNWIEAVTKKVLGKPIPFRIVSGFSFVFRFFVFFYYFIRYERVAKSFTFHSASTERVVCISFPFISLRIYFLTACSLYAVPLFQNLCLKSYVFTYSVVRQHCVLRRKTDIFSNWFLCFENKRTMIINWLHAGFIWCRYESRLHSHMSWSHVTTKTKLITRNVRLMCSAHIFWESRMQFIDFYLCVRCVLTTFIDFASHS